MATGVGEKKLPPGKLHEKIDLASPHVNELTNVYIYIRDSRYFYLLFLARVFLFFSGTVNTGRY